MWHICRLPDKSLFPPLSFSTFESILYHHHRSESPTAIVGAPPYFLMICSHTTFSLSNLQINSVSLRVSLSQICKHVARVFQIYTRSQHSTYIACALSWFRHRLHQIWARDYGLWWLRRQVRLGFENPSSKTLLYVFLSVHVCWVCELDAWDIRSAIDFVFLSLL